MSLSFTKQLCKKFKDKDLDIVRFLRENTHNFDVISIFHYVAGKSVDQNRGDLQLCNFVLQTINLAFWTANTTIINLDTDFPKGIYYNDVENPERIFATLNLIGETKITRKNIPLFLQDLIDEFGAKKINISPYADENFNTQIVFGYPIEIDGMMLSNGDVLVR